MASIPNLQSTVVLTRPRPQAEALALRLQAMGRNTFVFPLLEILPLEDPAPLQARLARLRDYRLVAFVSPNAIDAAFAHIERWPDEVEIAVMGEGSRQALARHGLTEGNARIISPRDPERSDSQTLLPELDMNRLRGGKVLIVRGESGRELLADALRAQGVVVEKVAAYRRVTPRLDETNRVLLLRLLRQDCEWVITSSEALRHLCDMTRVVAGDHGVVKMQQQSLIVPHARIAETAHSLGFVRVTQTASGDEAICAALQSRP